MSDLGTIALEGVARFTCPTRFEGTCYAMIGCYLDESFDMPQSGLFVVGGIMGRGVPIFELERRWEKLRERPDIGIKYFKASHCERGKGEFSKFCATPENPTPAEKTSLESISREFLELIAHPVLHDSTAYIVVHGVGVIQRDFYDVIQDANARAILGDDPYRLAYDFAVVQSAWIMKQLGTGECVAFVCDEHEQYGPLALQAFRKLKDQNPNASGYIGTYTSSDDRFCDALQAADAVAFEVRRAMNLALKQWPGKSLRKQFDILADAHSIAIVTNCNKDQLLHIVATHNAGEPFKLDSLMELQIDENITITL